MKKIVVASDSFKGTLTSSQICSIAKSVIPEYFPECDVDALAVADGGEGTVDCFLNIGAEAVSVKVSGPYFDKVDATYARIGNTAIIEMSSAAGITLTDKRDPKKATTYGVGELIRSAIFNGCKRIILGLGGSATNDGGCGMASALGAAFKDNQGREFIPSGGTLKDIASVSLDGVDLLLRDIDVIAMCDVVNPLYGENGAAYVFGPQKGADLACVINLDEGLRNLSRIMSEVFGEDISSYPGTGAAGGMGAGCMWFLKGRLVRGTETILDLIKLDSHLRDSDYVITGEGRLDAQTLGGKLVSGIKKRADALGVPVIAIVGSVKAYRGRFGKDDSLIERPMDATDLDLDGTLSERDLSSSWNEYTGLFKRIYITSESDVPLEVLRENAKEDYEKALRRFCEDVKGGLV